LNADPKVVHSALAWYNNFVETQEAAVAERDIATKAQVEDALRAEWGKDYRVNVNAMRGYLEIIPKEVATALQSARTDDGTAILNSPEVVKWFTALAREFNPVLQLPNLDGQPGGKGIEVEIAEIEKYMRTNNADYFKDEKMQERYRQLVEARNKIDERKGAVKAA
ncbi:MAG: hypothetical protein ACRD3R_06665, partial [Terriglobales bacterium]